MELRDFISSALIEISKGVNDANEDLGKTVSAYRSFIIRENCGDKKRSHDGIKFDIAVTVTEKDGKENSIGVSVLKIGAGSDYKKENIGEQTHRVQFEVNIESGIR